jgi:L-2-hydroxyglutarate oxidase LhgO
MEHAQVLIIGAGVVGLAAAHELSGKIKDIIVLEKNDGFGRETSSRNSEVVHGGMYYPQGSLKAKLCVEGRNLLYEICLKNRIPFRKTGKLIVAVNNDEVPALEKIFRQGLDNKVEGLSLIDGKDIPRFESNIKGVAAIHSPETGIIDSHALLRYYYDSAKEAGALVSFNTEAIAIRRNNRGYEVEVKNGNEPLTIACDFLINCAGLDSDTLCFSVGMDIKKLGYELHYCKGQYFRVAERKAKLIHGLVYPVPASGSAGLGVHATVDLGGGMRLGPDDFYLSVRNKDYSVDENSRRAFYESAVKFMPFITEADLSADISGIRPKLQGPGEGFRDFVIRDESSNGFPGFINCVGIESPGLTASAAIARFISGLIKPL